MSLDERRGRFPVYRHNWADLAGPVRYPFARALDASFQTDALEVWFAGNHSDVGGGSQFDVFTSYGPEPEMFGDNRSPQASLALLSFRWMFYEACRHPEHPESPKLLFGHGMAGCYGLEITYRYNRSSRADPKLIHEGLIAEVQDHTSESNRERCRQGEGEDPEGPFWAEQLADRIIEAPIREVECAVLVVGDELRLSTFGVRPIFLFLFWNIIQL